MPKSSPLILVAVGCAIFTGASSFADSGDGLGFGPACLKTISQLESDYADNSAVYATLLDLSSTVTTFNEKTEARMKDQQSGLDDSDDALAQGQALDQARTDYDSLEAQIPFDEAFEISSACTW